MWLPWTSGPLARLLSGWLLPMNHQLLSLVKETFLSGELADNFLLQDFILPIKQLEVTKLSLLSLLLSSYCPYNTWR